MQQLLGRKQIGMLGRKVLSLRYPLAWWLPGFGFLVLVATGSLIPSGGVITGFEHADKFVHAFCYFILMVWFTGLYAKGEGKKIAFVLVFFGILLEFIQGRLPYRFFDPLDLIANAVGVLFGLFLSAIALGGWCKRVESLMESHD